jgi:hypothetical protein
MVIDYMVHWATRQRNWLNQWVNYPILYHGVDAYLGVLLLLLLLCSCTTTLSDYTTAPMTPLAPCCCACCNMYHR